MPNDIDASLYGTGLLGEAQAPKRSGNLAERFVIPSEMRQAIVKETRPIQQIARIIIYGVSDPRTDEIRYVGVTKQLLRDRALSHAYSKGRSHRSRWFQKLRSEGIVPHFFILQELDDNEDWADAEQFWIAYWKFLGARLINRSLGGGGPKGLIRSKETREKMRQNALRQFSDPVAKAKCVDAMRAARRTPESRKRTSIASIEIQNRPEVKRKIVAAAIRQHADPEKKVKHAKAVRDALARPEVKAKRDAIFASQEFRDKVSKATSIGRQRGIAERRSKQ